MNILRRGLMPVAIGIAALGMSLSAPAAAAVVLNEGDFNTATYTLTPSFESGDTDITVGRCGSCGVPGSALRFRVFYDGPGAGSLGVVLNTLSYDPTASGTITSIDFSAVKNVSTTNVGNSTNTLRPLIAQNGNYYLAAIPLPDFVGPGATGYVPGTANLTASDFLLYDFATGTFGSANPDFAGSLIRFGIGQISSTPSAGENNSRIDYDNLSFTINQAVVPEPATWALMIGGMGLAGGTLRRRRSTVLRAA